MTNLLLSISNSGLVISFSYGCHLIDECPRWQFTVNNVHWAQMQSVLLRDTMTVNIETWRCIYSFTHSYLCSLWSYNDELSLALSGHIAGVGPEGGSNCSVKYLCQCPATSCWTDLIALLVQWILVGKLSGHCCQVFFSSSSKIELNLQSDKKA